MELEFSQMILPLMVATVLLFSSLLAYATAMHLIVRVMVRRSEVVPAIWDSGRAPPS